MKQPEIDPLTALIATGRERRALPSPKECRRLRERAGVLQLELAMVLGVSRVTLMRWEHGIHAPSGSRRMAYLDALRRLSG